eukprot:s3106_g15.t1
MQGDDDILVQAYAIQLRDVDKEVGILNFLEYLMYKIENDMETEPERWTEANEGRDVLRLAPRRQVPSPDSSFVSTIFEQVGTMESFDDWLEAQLQDEQAAEKEGAARELYEHRQEMTEVRDNSDAEWEEKIVKEVEERRAKRSKTRSQDLGRILLLKRRQLDEDVNLACAGHQCQAPSLQG